MNTQRIGMLIHPKRRTLLSIYVGSLARVIFSDTLKGDTFTERWAFEKGFRIGYLTRSLKVMASPFKNKRLASLYEEGRIYGWKLAALEQSNPYSPFASLVFHEGGFVRSSDGKPMATVHGPRHFSKQD